jgi:hypothetical protein
MGGGWVLGLDEGYVLLRIKGASLALRLEVIKLGALFELFVFGACHLTQL